MSRKPDYIKKKYSPMQQKSLHHALVHLLGEQFPRALGGERLRGACAEMILEVVAKHLRPREHLKHGQALWLGIDKHDPPARGKTMAQTRLLPLVLDLSLPDDIQQRIDRVSPSQRLLSKAVRLCHQAFEQGALLSNCDLAELLGSSDSQIASLLTAHERQTGKSVPRRATLHDVGTGLTHKRIICCKRYLEGKSSEVIAQETYHSIEAVDRYLGQFDRIRHCHKHNMTPEKTAYTLNCSLALVNEYLEIDLELEKLHD